MYKKAVLQTNQTFGLTGFEVSQTAPQLVWPKLIVYQKGDIVKQPMKKGSFVPKNVPGVGWGVGGVGWVI